VSVERFGPGDAVDCGGLIGDADGFDPGAGRSSFFVVDGFDRRSLPGRFGWVRKGSGLIAVSAVFSAVFGLVGVAPAEGVAFGPPGGPGDGSQLSAAEKSASSPSSSRSRFSGNGRFGGGSGDSEAQLVDGEREVSGGDGTGPGVAADSGSDVSSFERRNAILENLGSPEVERVRYLAEVSGGNGSNEPGSDQPASESESEPELGFGTGGSGGYPVLEIRPNGVPDHATVMSTGNWGALLEIKDGVAITGHYDGDDSELFTMHIERDLARKVTLYTKIDPAGKVTSWEVANSELATSLDNPGSSSGRLPLNQALAATPPAVTLPDGVPLHATLDPLTGEFVAVYGNELSSERI